MINEILNKKEFLKEDIIFLLKTEGDDRTKLLKKSAEIKQKYVGNTVYFRGLIEFSNICEKNCLYCGIRKDNEAVNRYNVTDKEILEAVKFAHKENYGSVVLQSGELDNKNFVSRISELLKEIKKITNGEIGITLSCGEQTEETYAEWFKNGAHRYLLRIETSNEDLYYKIHPKDEKHSFEKRLKALKALQNTGYQTGTGIMIGLPFQSIEDLANDIIFMREFDIDMCGMGPYILHENTPLVKYKNELLSLQERFYLTLKVIAVLRIVMKDINIAAATALQAIDPMGREKAIKMGANIIMPNITPAVYRKDYLLYENKPCTDEVPDDCKNCLKVRISMTDNEIGYGEWGDSKHYFNRQK